MRFFGCMVVSNKQTGCTAMAGIRKSTIQAHSIYHDQNQERWYMYLLLMSVLYSSGKLWYIKKRSFFERWTLRTGGCCGG